MASLRQPAGPAFPFGNTIASVLGVKTRMQSIQTAVLLILTTPVGTLPYDPTYGSQIPLLVFEPLDDSLINLLLYYAVEDVQRQEPRIKITAVSVDKVDTHGLYIEVAFVDADDVNEVETHVGLQFARGA